MFIPFCTVSFVDFEQVNVGWDFNTLRSKGLTCVTSYKSKGQMKKKNFPLKSSALKLF